METGDERELDEPEDPLKSTLHALEYPEGFPEPNVVVQDQGILTIPGTDCTADALHMYDSREVEYEKLPIGDEKLIVDDVAADLFTPLKSTHQLPE